MKNDTTRRVFLQGSASVAASLALGTGCSAQRGGDTVDAYPIIDCHTHFYDPHRPKGTPEFPPKGVEKLYRTVLPPEWEQLTAKHGITGTVVVEASTWVEDNDWILDLAKTEDAIVGLVGNLMPGTPGYSVHVKRLAKNPLFRGIRLRSPAFSGEISNNMNNPAFMDGLKVLADHDLELDIGMWAGTLGEVATIASRFGDLRIVINHVAELQIDGKPIPADTVAQLRAVADNPNVWMKVSALPEKAIKPTPTDPEFYFPFLNDLYNTFGEDRVIYGSNWPVSDMASDYDTLFNIVNTFFTDKGSAARKKYFYTNSTEAYKWVRRA